ncbi:MAG: ABC transporter substrate-binding protein [Bacteroidales bacterium]|nr:ABC transporter substrate-binding protein [Bacteroidales bacterium]
MKYIFLIFVSCVLFHSTEINGRSSEPIISEDTIKIGLLISDTKSVAAINGAEIAIQEANAKGGCNGIPFKLEIRSMEGPWGTGSKEAVSLIFEEEVWAIMGSHDGRNAHLAEQATAKTRIVFLSSWAADPTLSQAFVPWYFSCVPNNNQQAEVLFNEVYNKNKFNKIALISENNYDSNFAFKSFVNKITINGKPRPFVLSYSNADLDYGAMADIIIASNPECILLFGMPSSSIKIFEAVKFRDSNIPAFGTLSLMDENELNEKNLSVSEGITIISSDHWFTPEGKIFKEKYRNKYGQSPGSVAAYAYDGMNLIIESVKTASPDREKVQEAMANIRLKGVTGTIQFDERGNRKGPFHLMIIKNGVPVEINK